MDVGESEITKTTLKSVKFDVRNKKNMYLCTRYFIKTDLCDKGLDKITVHII